jgi:hypothetical protein
MEIEQCRLCNGDACGRVVPIFGCAFGTLGMVSKYGAGRAEERLTLNSRCSAVSANRTEILLPVSFHPRTIRP